MVALFSFAFRVALLSRALHTPSLAAPSPCSGAIDGSPFMPLCNEEATLIVR